MRTGVRPEKSCSPGKIVVMETLNDRKFDYLARFGEPHRAPVRRILVQGQVRSPRMIIIQIRGQKSLEMTFVEDDGVIQQLSPQATDLAFNIVLGLGHRMHPM